MIERDRRRVAEPRRDREQIMAFHDPRACGRMPEVVGHAFKAERVADGLPDLAPPHAPVEPLPALRLGDEIATLGVFSHCGVQHLAELRRDGDRARGEALGGLDSALLHRSPDVDGAVSYVFPAEGDDLGRTQARVGHDGDDRLVAVGGHPLDDFGHGLRRPRLALGGIGRHLPQLEAWVGGDQPLIRGRAERGAEHPHDVVRVHGLAAVTHDLRPPFAHPGTAEVTQRHVADVRVNPLLDVRDARDLRLGRPSRARGQHPVFKEVSERHGRSLRRRVSTEALAPGLLRLEGLRVLTSVERAPAIPAALAVADIEHGAVFGRSAVDGHASDRTASNASVFDDCSMHTRRTCKPAGRIVVISRGNDRSGRPGSNRRPSAWECVKGECGAVASGIGSPHVDGVSSGSTVTPSAPGFRRISRRMFEICSMAAVLGCGSIFAASPATAKPCEKHVGTAKVACVKQAKRDAMPYPPNPSWSEATRRLSAYDLATAERVSACEEPGSEHGTGRGRSPWARRWSLSGSGYVSGFGMASSTYGIGARITGYPYPPEASPAQQLLVAVAGAHSFGWSGWGCF